MKHRKAHWVPEATCQFRTGVLKKKKKKTGVVVVSSLGLLSGENGLSWQPSTWKCQVAEDTGQEQAPARPGVSPQDGCDLWGSAAVTASALGPLPPPDKQVIRRGAEVLAELPGR